MQVVRLLHVRRCASSRCASIHSAWSAGLHVLVQLLQHVAAIADDRHRGRHVLADLGRVDVDVDDLGVGRELAQLAGHAVVEAHADADQHVALVDGAVGMDPAVHAQEADS